MTDYFFKKIHSYIYHLAKMITVSQGLFANMHNQIHIQWVLRTVIFYSYTFFLNSEENHAAKKKGGKKKISIEII